MCVLMAWVADLEEQLMITGVSPMSCPVCKAGSTGVHNLDAHAQSKPHTAAWILAELRAVH